VGQRTGLLQLLDAVWQRAAGVALRPGAEQAGRIQPYRIERERAQRGPGACARTGRALPDGLREDPGRSGGRFGDRWMQFDRTFGFVDGWYASVPPADVVEDQYGRGEDDTAEILFGNVTMPFPGCQEPVRQQLGGKVQCFYWVLVDRERGAARCTVLRKGFGGAATHRVDHLGGCGQAR